MEHPAIKADDGLGMMKLLMEARPRLIRGMDGLAGTSSWEVGPFRQADHGIGPSIKDDAGEPGSSSGNLSGGKFKFWDRKGLSSVLKEQDVSVAVTPNG